MREPMAEITNEIPRPGTSSGKRGAVGAMSRPLSVFRSGGASGTMTAPPDIYVDPNEGNAVVTTELRDDALLRIMREEAVQSSDRLIALTEKGDHAGVEAMLQEGADLSNCVGLHGFTPMHHACSRNQSAVVSVLIKYHADIMRANHAGETPLHLAAYAGNLLVVEQLLDCGADINATNRDGETTLFYAARQSKPAMVRLLLQRGALPHLEDRFGDVAADQADDARTRAALATFDEDAPDMTGGGGLEKERIPAMTIPYTELVHVFRFLGARDVCRAAMTCGKWHRVSECEELWHALGVRRWELALQSSLGFGASAASSFARPSSSKSRKDRSKPKSR